MYFFAAKGITPVQNGMAEITVGALFTDNQQSGNPDGIKEQIDTITNRYNKWLYLFHISSC